jgi:hypothetical protein
MTRRRPDVQPCGERHERYLHCLTCNPPPAENPDRLQGPAIGTVCLYRSKSFPQGVRVIVTAQSYVWAPGDPAYHGGARRYDWKCVRIDPDAILPPFFGGRGLCVDDVDLTPVQP